MACLHCVECVNNSELSVLQLDTGLLSSCLPELTKMARKFTHISTLLQVSVCMLYLALLCTKTNICSVRFVVCFVVSSSLPHLYV